MLQTTVNLQEDIEYSLIPLIIICVLFIIGVLIFILTKKKIVKTQEIKEIPKRNSKNIPVIKNKYLEQLSSIEYKYTNSKIDLRQAYLMMSEAVRMFVFEITDITTQNYSLAEIKKLNIPELYILIEEYYEPEFANKPEGDFNSSISKARRVINEWK